MQGLQGSELWEAELVVEDVGELERCPQPASVGSSDGDSCDETGDRIPLSFVDGEDGMFDCWA